MRRHTVQEIANYIVWDFHEAGSFLSNAKLQKLLYYAQAWHLAIHDRPLFAGRFEAWEHGPVLPSIYNRFERYGWRNIDEFIPEPLLEPETKRFLRRLLEEYGPIDVRKLECMIREEDPWGNARRRCGVGLEGPCEALIDEAEMRDYYRERMDPDAASAEMVV